VHLVQSLYETLETKFSNTQWQLLVQLPGKLDYRSENLETGTNPCGEILGKTPWRYPLGDSPLENPRW